MWFCLRTCKFGYIYVDIDGPNKGKSTLGIDLFQFNIDINRNSIHPSSYSGFGYCFYEGLGCADWVIKTGSMDYLNTSIDSEYGSATCKNGHVLSFDAPFCK